MKTIRILILTLLISNVFVIKKANSQVVEGIQLGLDLLGNLSGAIEGLDQIEWLNASKEALMLKKIYELNKEIENARRNIEWIKKIETFEKMGRSLEAILCTTYEINMYSKFYRVGACGNNIQLEIAMMDLQKARDLFKLILDVGNSLSANDRANSMKDAADAISEAHESMNGYLSSIREAEYDYMQKQYLQNQKARAYSANPNRR